MNDTTAPDADSTPEVACTLTEEGRARRSDRVESTLTDAYEGSEALPNGYVVRFAGTDDALSAAAAFVAAELRCCSFAAYSLDVSPPYEETHLTVTGPEGTKETFRDLLARLERSDGEA
ncbi:MAG: Zn-dependent oxidoreductase [Haloglomus sp.]